MPITPNQYQAAQVSQHSAAQDPAPQVRLVAGPGTGKSFSIGERVHWLLDNGIPATGIYAVSFTNASAKELESGIADYLTGHRGYQTPPPIHVSTLHSLALSALTRAGQLGQYSAAPVMLDKWAQSEIYDCELADAIGATKTRAYEVRIHEESVWNTGAPPSPHIIQPNPPIRTPEVTGFHAFHNSKSALYACLLPGESVRRCVDLGQAGLLNPVDVLNIRALIVDEFQDLNSCDQELVDQISSAGVSVFVAGDDDQSIYAFRYGSPEGIQQFQNTYPNATSHTLQSCFRCTTSVLDAATNVITSHAAPGRLPKQLNSAYSASNPPEAGSLHTWSFAGEVAEARGIAESCQQLVNAGINPEDILILLTQKSLSQRIEQEMQTLGVPFVGPGTGAFIDTKSGRFVASLLRVAANPAYLIGYRTMLGLLSGTGVQTCKNLADRCINNNARYADVFLLPLPPWLTGRPLAAVNRIRGALALVSGWQRTDLLQPCAATLTQILSNNLTAGDVTEWQLISGNLPATSTLNDLIEYLEAENDGMRQDVLSNIQPAGGVVANPATTVRNGVRLMTLHSSKGLSARVVFIPALEENSLPSIRDSQFPGLALQAARLLYVGMTRARASLILSFARSRPEFITSGRRGTRTPSRFIASVGQPFTRRNGGLLNVEANAIANAIQNL